jgi:hypothetical protein
MSLLGYNEKDIERMNEIVLYSREDSVNGGDEESALWLGKVSDLLEGLLEEGRV